VATPSPSLTDLHGRCTPFRALARPGS